MRGLRCLGFLALLLTAACDGCGGSGVQVIDDPEGVRVGQRVSVGGLLSLRGSTPFTTLVVELESGTAVTVTCEDPALMSELRGLVGLHCQVEGTVLTPLTPGTMSIEASRYELLPLPTGELPIAGIMQLEDGECVLTATNGKRYWIRGELAGVIREYPGARLWIVGERADTDAPGPRHTTPFVVTGYGVIDEAPAH
ncbi:MAG TPA: hypothetical protein VFX92_02035 [Candidatus Krumholzibacteria bacterium]|nr:hypothetical protein [Candidatus Krumholzibacteria bacterium]